MKAKLVQMVEGALIVSTFNTDNLVAAMADAGLKQSGVNQNGRQRAELQGQPKFDGVVGPMWDGDCLRYECPEAYRALSA